MRDLSLNRRYLEWAVPVVAGYALGNFVPYAGILYKDYTMKDRYEFTKTYAGEDYTVRIDEIFPRPSQAVRFGRGELFPR